MKKLIARKFVPLYGVLVVLVLAFMSPIPTLASGGLLGHGNSHAAAAASHSDQGDANVGAGSDQSRGGYGNNCGIKGDGTHDHGKTCPNYPFPGRGH